MTRPRLPFNVRRGPLRAHGEPLLLDGPGDGGRVDDGVVVADAGLTDADVLNRDAVDGLQRGLDGADAVAAGHPGNRERFGAGHGFGDVG